MKVDFKVGDKVERIDGGRTAIVAAVGIEALFVEFDGRNGLWNKAWCRAMPSIPTPPEGREVEPDKRQPKRGDVYWMDDRGHPDWIPAGGDHIPPLDGPRYCLRPLPPKPEGEGLEWRKWKEGDEYQTLTLTGDAGIVFQASKPDESIRLGYRWCRAKPKVRRFDHHMRISSSVHETTIPMIDDGTGPRLDTDKIGREWAIKWLSKRYVTMHTDHLAAELCKEQESNNERD